MNIQNIRTRSAYRNIQGFPGTSRNLKKTSTPKKRRTYRTYKQHTKTVSVCMLKKVSADAGFQAKTYETYNLFLL
nr:MAG TPA: hypothetical protein [Caudoviricetes sp.]